MSDGVSRRVDSTRVAYASIVAFGIALCAVLGIAALSIATIILDRPVFGLHEWLPFFLLIFPLFGRAVFELNRPAARQRKQTRPRGRFRVRFDQPRGLPNFDDLAGAIPSSVLASLCVAGLLAVINFFIELALTVSLGGQPSHNARSHRYELTNHGSVMVVSRAVYQHAVAVSGRAFMGGAAVFLLLSMPVALNRWLRWRLGQGQR